MAKGMKIRGVTIEIGGDTTGLEKALGSVNKEIQGTQKQLKDVQRLLKLDPANTELVAQQQELLGNAIAETRKKLEALENAQEEVKKAFSSGDIGKEQYMAFQREVEATRAALKGYESELEETKSEQDRLAANTERLKKLFNALDADVDDYAEVLGGNLVRAIKNGTASSDQLKTAIEKVGKSATGGKADIKQLTDALDTVDDGQAVGNLISEIGRVGDAAKDSADDIAEMAEVTKGAALMQAADQLSAVGDKIKGIGDSAVSVFTETENASKKVSSYFGETGEAAKESAAQIKEIYESGVGESMDAVSEGVIAVRKHLEDLSDTDLTNITQQAMTLDELYGIDMNETLRGANALMKQYGMTAQQAMDYIVKGTQNGLDKTNELGDNLSEYAGKFAQAGYSVTEYFQLLDNGLQGGAYNLDKVNDAINEVTTRLADGTIGESIDQYSDKTGELFKQWQNGEATQKQVIDSIVSDIAGCTSEQQALNMAAQAFGTMAEDGNLKFITSLTSVGDTYDKVTGAAQNLFDDTSTGQQAMTSATRKLNDALEPLGETLVKLATEILPPVTSIIAAISGWFSSLPGPVKNFTVILGVLLAAFTALTPVIAALALAFGTLNVAILPIVGIIAGIAAAVVVAAAVIKSMGTAFGEFYNTNDEFRSKADAIWSQIQAIISAAAGKISQIIETLAAAGAAFWNAFGDDIIAVAKSAFGFVQTYIQTVMTVIQDILSVVLAVINGDWAGAWEAMKTLVVDIFLGLQALFTASMEILKNILQLGLNVLIALWEALKTAVIDIALKIRDAVVERFNAMKEKAVEIFVNLRDAVEEKVAAVKTAIVDGITQAVDWIKGLPGQALQWGKDFINGFVDGIKATIGKVTDAVKGVADAVSQFLHFSRPDKGPLRYYETWMPDMMEGLSKGIRENMGKVTGQIEVLAGKMQISPQKEQKGTNLSGVETMLRAIMQEMGGIGNAQIVLDDGTLVGRMLPQIDRRMRQSEAYYLRGGTV